MKSKEQIEKCAEEIAKDMLDIQTLEVRGLDSLDFHDVGVGALKKALVKMYILGLEDAKNKKYETGLNHDGYVEP